MSTRRRLRWAWWLLAYASLGLGVVGIFVPGLPTTVFVLIAAWAAARGSERLETRLLAHPYFGPMIHVWRQHRAVPRHAKWAATWMMLGCTGVLAAMTFVVPFVRGWLAALPIGCMVVVGTWLWLRPEPPRRDASRTPVERTAP